MNKTYHLALFKEATFTDKEGNKREYSSLYLVDTKDDETQDILKLKTVHSEINKEELRTMKMGQIVTLETSFGNDGVVKVTKVNKA